MMIVRTPGIPEASLAPLSLAAPASPNLSLLKLARGLLREQHPSAPTATSQADSGKIICQVYPNLLALKVD